MKPNTTTFRNPWPRFRTWFLLLALFGGCARPYAAVASQPTLLDRFLDGPMKGNESIVFAVRQPGKDGHWYANFSYYAANPERKAYGDGGRLCRLDLRTGRLAVLLDDPKGGVRDPQVHYDGQRIVFSYRKGGTPNYLLYEINGDGSGLRQLTHGDYDDIEPAYLPDGGIAFVSSRCKRWVNCWLTQVATLHRCESDGSNLRAISSNNEQDNTPWPLPDGRLLYTRWEYVDRSQVDYHHLWTVNPDGTGQMVYYGNLHPGVVMIDAKPVPGSDKIIASFSPGHGAREHDGELALVDSKAGPDEPATTRRISRGGYRDPWAFSEEAFLAANGPNLTVMDASGHSQQVFQLSEADRKAGLECHEPRPLAARPLERIVQPRIDLKQDTGRLLLADVHVGRNMTGLKPGEIKKLLVLESLPMPIHYTGGMEPMSYGGTFTLERIVGTVPVEPDGSAYFELPALRSFFFVALDDQDLAVKRMQSFVTVQPGETTSCVGCHEQRTQTPGFAAKPSMAFHKPASRIEPVAGVPEVIDFPRDVQPILDSLCVNCHGYEKTPVGGPRAGRLILAGDRGPLFSHSHYMLTIARLFSDGRNQPVSNYAPRTLGSSASRLLKLVDGSHYGAKATDAQRNMIRLWIDTGAAYPGTYAALGTGMIGNYDENQQINMDTAWPSTQAGAAVIGQRCAGCHNDPARLLPMSLADERGVSFWQPSMNDPRLLTSRHIVFNLSRPEKSLMLLAPLSADAGGWGLCRDPKTRQPVTVFASTSDPGYQSLLAMCAGGRDRLREDKRFDMSDFRPRVDWVREMKRYGILPESTSPQAVADVYSVERSYWASLWYQPK